MILPHAVQELKHGRVAMMAAVGAVILGKQEVPFPRGIKWEYIGFHYTY